MREQASSQAGTATFDERQAYGDVTLYALAFPSTRLNSANFSATEQLPRPPSMLHRTCMSLNLCPTPSVGHCMSHWLLCTVLFARWARCSLKEIELYNYTGSDTVTLRL